MIDADLDAYVEIIKRWKIAFDATKVGSEKMDYLFGQLRHVTIDEFRRAAADWERRGQRFPKLADIYESMRRTKQVQTSDQMAVVDPDNPYCRDCRDSGWHELWCIGDEKNPEWDPKPHFNRDQVHCGRQHDHAGHEFMKVCACRPNNPVLRTKKSLTQAG